MKKEIKIDYAYVSEKTVCFSIIKQTHRHRKFGRNENDNTFTAKNGIILYSSSYPEVRMSARTLFVRGDEPGMDDAELRCSADSFALIQEAINEYNLCFDGFDDTLLPKNLFEW